MMRLCLRIACFFGALPGILAQSHAQRSDELFTHSSVAFKHLMRDVEGHWVRMVASASVWACWSLLED